MLGLGKKQAAKTREPEASPGEEERAAVVGNGGGYSHWERGEHTGTEGEIVEGAGVGRMGGPRFGWGSRVIYLGLMRGGRDGLNGLAGPN